MIFFSVDGFLVCFKNFSYTLQVGSWKMFDISKCELGDAFGLFFSSATAKNF